MTMITCKECNKSISDTAPACIHCGAPIVIAKSNQEPVKDTKKKLTWTEAYAEAKAKQEAELKAKQEAKLKAKQEAKKKANTGVMRTGGPLHVTLGLTLALMIGLVYLATPHTPEEKLAQKNEQAEQAKIYAATHIAPCDSSFDKKGRANKCTYTEQGANYDMIFGAPKDAANEVAKKGWVNRGVKKLEHMHAVNVLKARIKYGNY